MTATTGTGTIQLTIQDVSLRTGLSESTLRYYERIGLIRGVGRDPATGHRRYADHVVEEVEALACLRATGMGIADLRRYLAGVDAGVDASSDLIDLFSRHTERLAAQVEELKVRQAYTVAKVDLWRARRDGLPEAEVGERLRAIATTLRGGA